MERDPFETQKKLLKNQCVNTVFDVGAHCGDVTQTFLELFEKTRVYSFEPYETAYGDLARRFEENDRVLSFPWALDCEQCTKPLFVYANPRANSFSKLSSYTLKNPLNPEKCIFVRKETVQTKTIDSFCSIHGIKGIDLLKIDVQGAELKVLKGAENMLEAGAICLVYAELQFQELYEETCLYFEVAEFLNKYGYRLYGLYNLVWGHDGLLRHGDGIFISRKVLEESTEKTQGDVA